MGTGLLGMSQRTFSDPHGTSLEARQGLLDNRCEKGPKRHRTLGRRRRMSTKKKAKVKHALAIQKAANRRFHAMALAYWRGEREDHP